jgi:hypothetical protein
MSFSFGDDPTGSDVDYVRDKLQDIDEDSPLLSDESIQAEIDAVGKIMAASRCARKIAARFSRKVTKSIGSRSIQYSNLAGQYWALAKELDAEVSRDRMAFSVPTISRVRDSTDMPTSLMHSDIKRADWTDEDQTNENITIDEVPR